MTANLKLLIGKLNTTCRRAAEQAINYCVSRGHYEVEPEHLLLALLDNAQSDFALLARHYGIATSVLEMDLHEEIASLKAGNTRTPVFSPRLSTLFERAWLLASLDTEVLQVRSAHLVVAMLSDDELSQLAHRASGQFGHIVVDELKHKFNAITASFPEGAASVSIASAGFGNAASVCGSAEGDGELRHNTPALDRFTDNLTRKARDGGVDPVIGRDAEIRQLIDILMRRRQNNPILTGEAGVGKTAVVEGLAQRIAARDVPPGLADVALHVLDLGLLQAGASVKGEFESRLRSVIDEVKRSPYPIVLFIDEAHTMIGAGGQAGQNDAANLLKPALARGELRTIAATTWSEYKKYFEKDAALARRFQVVKVEEPSESAACAMLRGMALKMEAHFNVRVLDEAISEAVRLTARYVSGRQLPDKAISVLDTACARVALGQTATPPALEDARRNAAILEEEIASLEREASAGASHGERLSDLITRRAAMQAELTQTEARWEQEKVLVARIRELRMRLEGERDDRHCGNAEVSRGNGKIKAAAANAALLKELARAQDELALLQGESPLVSAFVDGQAIGEIVSSWTGIPLGKMVKNEINTVLNLRTLLEERVVGQSHALEQIAQRIRTARANIEDPGKPKGVFLFVGPSGVGKTETALALADVLYGGERNMVTINMSEYQEAHTVSGLKGSPPGYVGFGEGGVLTEAVRRRPHSVVLLDEIEKAHPDVLELFFQVFDKGVMDDAEGREVDFRNTVIVLTSNVASQAIMQACLNKSDDALPDPDALAEKIRPQLYKAFKPAFLGRTKVIPYYPLPDAVLADIVRLKLEKIRKRVMENHKSSFSYADEVIDAVLERCTEVDSGARNVDHILNGTVLPEVAETVLARMAEGKAIRSVRIGLGKAHGFVYRVN